MCDKHLPMTEFKAHKGHKDGLQSQCVSCQREYRRQHYLANKEKYCRKAREWDKQFYDWWWEYKSQYSCSRCGEDHPACIQFHHVGEKEDNVSSLLGTGNKEKIIQEIAKCIPLCANCHFKEHYKR